MISVTLFNFARRGRFKARREQVGYSQRANQIEADFQLDKLIHDVAVVRKLVPNLNYSILLAIFNLIYLEFRATNDVDITLMPSFEVVLAV